MIRISDMDGRLADVELCDGKLVFRRVVVDKIINTIESVRRGRSDSEVYHALPEIFDGQCWAEHLSLDETPGPDDEIVEPPAD
jgi:hypothetical protein